MIRTIFTVLFLLSTMAFADGLPKDSLIGNWVSNKPLYGQGSELHLAFSFTEKTMTLSGTCAFYNNLHNMEVSVTTPIKYKDNFFFIRHREEGVISDGFRFCRVFVEPSRWEFFVDEDQAILLAPVPYNTRFKLSKVESLN